MNQPCSVFSKMKRERVERQRRAQPDETAEAHVDARAECVGVRRAHAAVDAVGADEQVGVAVGIDIGDVGLELHLDADLGRAFL